jgi:hypothetical protein
MKREILVTMVAVVLGGGAYAADTAVKHVAAFDRVGTVSVGETARKRFEARPEVRNALEREARAPRNGSRPDSLPERKAELVRRLFWLMVAAR